MLEFLRQRWFLLSLVAVLVGGIAWPATMRPITDLVSGDAVLAVITFIMALPLRSSVLWQAVRRPGPAWLGSLISSGIAPPLGWLASRFLPLELAAGVILATAVPSTVSSAAVITRRAGGNDAVAFLVTMITSLSCFLVIPFWLWLLVGIRADLDYGKIVQGLLLLVALPIVVAQLLRLWRPIGDWSTRHKHALSNLAQVGVLVMVLIGAVFCGERFAALEQDSLINAWSILLMIVAVSAVHSVLVVIGFGSSRVIALDRADAIAVAFSGSQKTLMVGVYLSMAIGPLAILPMVAYHAAQLIIDTLIGDRLRQQSDPVSVETEF